MDHFELVSEYKPTGDQPQAIEELVEGFKEGKQFQTLLGVTGSGKTFTMANVIEQLNKPTLIIAHNKTLAAQLYGEFKEFFPNNAVEYFVSYYDYYQPEAYVPSTDTYIAKDSAVNDEIDKLILSALIIAAVAAILAVFFKTRPGMAIRATGDNEEMVRSSSINADVSKCLGIVIANACVGLSGSLICQYQMFSDVGYGTGMVVIGLASIIIGESICGRRGVGVGILSACVGSAVYRIIIALALRFEIFPSYALKLISAVIVALSIAIPTAKKAIGNARMKSQRRNVQ